MSLMLNRDEIASLGIIIGGAENQQRAASYDVRVGTDIAIQADGKVHVDEEFYKVEPHGMVEVISRETIKIPANVAGYASVMTRLAREGLLALNTGILDPGYQGPVSAVMVNFGNTPKCLKRDDPFLRLTFHHYDPPSNVQRVSISREEFVQERKKEVGERFSESFLDIKAQTGAIVRGIFWKSLGYAALVVTLVAMTVTFVTWGVTIGVAHWQGGFLSKDQVRSAVDEYFSSDFKSVKSELTGFQKEELRREIRASVQQALDEEHTKSANSTEKTSTSTPKQRSTRGAKTK